MAYQDYLDDVQKIYIGYYQRPADPEGLLFWAAKLDASSGDLNEIINAFAASQESLDLYGTISPSNIDNVINQIYESFFGRAAEAEGLTFYHNGFISGQFTAGTLMLDILNGAQNDDLEVITNKVVAAERFTGVIDPEFDGRELLATYEGETDAVLAREWLADVGLSPATIPSEAETTSFIQTYIADEGDTILREPTTFNLTAGVDTPHGTAANDLILGYVDDGDVGDPGSTYQVADVIDGSAGYDTLAVLFDNDSDIDIQAPIMQNVENVVFRLTEDAASTSMTVDMSLVTDVTDFKVQLLADDASADVYIEDFTAQLTTLTLNGVDSDANSGSSDLYFYLNTNDAAPIGIETLTVSNILGSADVEIDNLTNLPVLNLTNIDHFESGTVSLEVLDTVATGTDDTLTINATNAGVWNFTDSYSVDICEVENASGDAVIENLVITSNGLSNYITVDSDTELVKDITITGAADLYLGVGDASQVANFDASAMSGDLSFSETIDVSTTVALGSGNDYFDLALGDDDLTATLDAGAGNDWIDVYAYTTDAADDITVNTGSGNDFVYLDVVSGNAYDINLGAGDDFFQLAGTESLTDTDTINAGAGGFDTIIADSAEFAASDLSGATGFENLVAEATTSATFDLDNLSGLDQVTVGGYDSFGIGPSPWYDPDATSDFQNVSGDNAIIFDNAEAGVDLAINDSDSASITMNLADDGAADAMTILIGSPAGTDVSVATFSTADAVFVNDIETLTINSTGGDNLIGGLSATDMTTLIVTGDSNLEIANIDVANGAGTTPELVEIDASAFTGNLVFDEASDTINALQVQLGSGDDTYFGTAFGDTIRGGEGADTITLGAAGENDTLIYNDSDSTIVDEDDVTGFVSTEDTIDLGSFAFTGTLASAIIAKGDIDISAYDEDTSIADFFVSTGVQRGVAFVTDGVDTTVFVDANHDGDFSGAADIAIQLTGTATVTLGDFGF